MLIDKGADVNFKDLSGKPVLMVGTNFTAWNNFVITATNFWRANLNFEFCTWKHVWCVNTIHLILLFGMAIAVKCSYDLFTFKLLLLSISWTTNTLTIEFKFESLIVLIMQTIFMRIISWSMGYTIWKVNYFCVICRLLVWTVTRQWWNFW